MKNGPKQVAMAPFGTIFIQNRSYGVWEASGMPPGPQTPRKKIKNPGFRGLGVKGENSAYFPYRGLYICVCILV